MIKLNNISKKFDEGFSLNSISLDFKLNESVALMGANGAGKTTMIRAMLGYYHINSGSILINGLDSITHREQILENIAFVPQLPPPIKLSVKELITYASISSNIKKDLIIDFATKMNFDIMSNANKAFFNLSGGMKQKLLIAIALARDTSIMIFDEPTANLDIDTRDNFYKLLQKQQKDKILIFVTHRIDELKNIINRKIYLDLGRVVDDEQV